MILFVAEGLCVYERAVCGLRRADVRLLDVGLLCLWPLWLSVSGRETGDDDRRTGRVSKAFACIAIIEEIERIDKVICVAGKTG